MYLCMYVCVSICVCLYVYVSVFLCVYESDGVKLEQGGAGKMAHQGKGTFCQVRGPEFNPWEQHFETEDRLI